MPIVDEKRMLGNYGSALVAHILSRFCLVRPVAEGTDIGVDLYCETVEKEQGFLHFWVQVKSGHQVKMRSDGGATCNFRVDHLEYWRRQPVPVFAFYVNRGTPTQSSDSVFFSNITMYALTHKIDSTKAKYKTVRADDAVPIANSDWHAAFLWTLAATSSVIAFRDHGIVAEMPELTPGYVRHWLVIRGMSQKSGISLQAIRRTACTIVKDAADLAYSSGIEPSQQTRKMQRILSLYEDGGRPEVMEALALWSAVIDRDNPKAERYIQRATQSIIDDPNPMLDQHAREKWMAQLEPTKRLIQEVASNHNCQ